MSWWSEQPAVRRAFSLIEVLIAIALLLALVGSMYGFFFDMLRSRAGAIEHMQQRTAASAFTKQLEADLMSCVAADASMGAGLKGTSTQLRVLTRGVAASLSAGPAEGAAALGDLQFTEYRFDPERWGIDMRRGPATSGQADGAEFSQLQGAIYKLRFRYHDGRVWRTSFDSAAEGGLPVAVEAAIWLRPTAPDREEHLAGFAAEGDVEPQEPMGQGPRGFDEQAFARQSDAEADDEPAPDRVRIFVIPDADRQETPEGLPEAEPGRMPGPASQPEEPGE